MRRSSNRAFSVSLALMASVAFASCSDANEPDLFLVLAPSTMTLQACQERLVSASVSQSNASTIVFQSSNATIATVSASGTVRGVKAGSTRVHAWLADNQAVRDSSDVTVAGSACP